MLIEKKKLHLMWKSILVWLWVYFDKQNFIPFPK